MYCMKKIYFVRHGESTANVDGIRLGADTPLTDNGHSQARVIANRFKNIDIEVVLTSAYMRAYDTGKMIADTSNVSLETVQEAHERIVPQSIIGRDRKDKDVQERINNIFEGWKRGEKVYDDAESFEEIVARADALINIIEQRSENNIVITSHSLFGKIFTQRILLGEYLSAEQFLYTANKMKPSNTGVTHFIIGDDGQWSLVNWNDDAHLGELV